MMLTILIIFLFINGLPALYYGKKYFSLKKNKASDKEFKNLSESMMKSERIVLPVSIILLLVLYFIN
ncbi:hypothetical protein [Staphylococcus durrellii]|uniref:hypothetical protein n=1 Tax=Staphylococcus durrellii TaxID=2781773 RepID=UPI00189EA39A|nr:hypothetical protein [Staphylococcus durrellii]MBF7018131.1 hypothetical protein [Staphylococcus durrellii]